MNFNEAMKAIKAGKKVRRRSWNSAFCSAGICDKDLNQYFTVVKPCVNEFLSEDWYIVEEKLQYKIEEEFVVYESFHPATNNGDDLHLCILNAGNYWRGRKIKVTVETID